MRVRQTVEFHPWLPTPKLKGYFNMPQLTHIIKADSVQPAIMWCPIEEEPIKHLIKEIVPIEVLRHEDESEIRKTPN